MKAHDKFTAVTDAQLRGLQAARASGVETRAYMLLTRFHSDPAAPSRAYVSASLASDKMGISQRQFTNALAKLAEKAFTTDAAGRPVPIITRIAKGHNGRVATYEDNLYRKAVLEGSYPKGTQNSDPTGVVGTQDSDPTQAEVGTQNSDPTGVVGTQNNDPTENAPAASRDTENAALDNGVVSPEYEELLERQPNKQGKGTEEVTSKVDIPVSSEAAPLDSYGMTDEERARFYESAYDDLAGPAPAPARRRVETGARMTMEEYQALPDWMKAGGV